MAVTREKLYEEVWAEPMTKVAARYHVSSNYLARICKQLKVPHPGRGHWAQVEVGKQEARPALPAARPGDDLEWSRDGEPRRVPPELPAVAASPLPAAASVRRHKASHHGLILGAREHFEAAKESWWDEYPKPRKRVLVDIVVSKEGIERALRTANKLFLELEAQGLPVVLSPRVQQWRRPSVDPKRRSRPQNDYDRGWTPDRPTFAYYGTVAIGLTLFEIAEESSFETVDGKKVRLTAAAAERKKRYSYVSTAYFPTSRFVLRAYSPYPDTAWSKEWEETKPGELAGTCADICAEMKASAPVIVEQVKEAEIRAEARRKEWEEQHKKWEAERKAQLRREAEQRLAQAKKDSFDQLVGIIREWSFACDMEQFFERALESTVALGHDERATVETRLRNARALFGGTEPLEHFHRWRTFEER